MDKLRSLCSVVRTIGNFLQSPLLLLIRLCWGYQFFITGFGKLINLKAIASYFQTLGVPLPYVSATLTGCIEMIGGILLFFGLFSRLATIPLLCILTVAYLTAEHAALVALANWSLQPFLSATPFLFAYTALIIFCFGPGKISLDYFLVNKNKEMP